jgi:hypothetical protein
MGKGKKDLPSSDALRSLSRKRYSPENVNQLWNEIRSESDRSVAIVCGSLVEDALRVTLEQAMKHLEKNENKELFGHMGPLGSLLQRYLLVMQ